MNWSVDAPLTVHQHDNEKMVDTTGEGEGDIDTKEKIEMLEHTTE
jgi:hypothetical protein